VLKDMYEQHYLTYGQYMYARSRPLPTAAEIHLPAQQPSAAPYFTSWVEPQVVAALEREGLSAKEAQYVADYGGLKIRLSIDLNLQNDAQQTVDNELFTTPGMPSAALVAIDNRTGEVRAMVSGDNNYDQSPFNLATLGYRQPGSSFKIFTLAAALSERQIGPYSEVDSRPITINWFYKTPLDAVAAPNGTGRFPVHNFGNVYSGLIPMTVATATSDNSVFAQVGTRVGTGAVATYAQLLGIRSPLSRNPAMILGGLNHGVSVLDMAHAYSTVANGGKKVYNPVLGDSDYGPVGIHSISNCQLCRQSTITNRGTFTRQVITPQVAETISYLLHGPVEDSYGTGTAAAIPGVVISGKTGTTSNYEDAWFVGYTPQMTVAVWVGYPDRAKPMTTLFNGKPVEGGTYPAIIWHNFMVGALQILQDEQQHKTSAAATVTNQVPTNTYTVSTTAATTTTSAAATSTVNTQTTPATQSNQPATLQNQAVNTATTQTPSSTGAGQSQTLPQATTTPTPESGTSTGAGNGGSGL
jgi:penicillin-binding protein 1A